MEGRVSLSGLVIHPPPGFEPHPLLSLDSFEVDAAPWSLIKGTVVIENLMVKGLSLHIVRDKNGRLSPLGLIVDRETGPASGSEKEQEGVESP